MIKKIVLSLMLVCLFIAIPLAIMGYEKVELGGPFLALMKSVNNELQEWKIEIPDIPNIPLFEDATGIFIILNAFIKFANVIIWLINALSDLINVVLQLIQFIVLLIKNLIAFKDNIANTNSLPII